MSTAENAAIPPTGLWRIDSVHSTASFTVIHHVVSTFRASFRGISGKLERGVLSGSVPVESLDIGGNAIFKQSVLAGDWFDAAHHPTLSFASSELRADPAEAVEGSGELTIKGITKPVILTGTVRGPLEVTLADGSLGQRLGLDLTTTLDRREFGLLSSGGAAWDVLLEVALELMPL